MRKTIITLSVLGILMGFAATNVYANSGVHNVKRHLSGNPGSGVHCHNNVCR